MKDLPTKLAAMCILLLAVIVVNACACHTNAQTLKETSVQPTAIIRQVVATRSETKKAKPKSGKQQITTTKPQPTTKKKRPKTTEPATTKPATTRPTTTAAPTYSDWELEMMSIVIYREAGGDAYSNKTRIMVGNVVMNRVRSKHFPNTIYGVLTQRGQYAGMSGGVTWPRMASNRWEQHAVKRARQCAKRVLEGENYLPANVVYQSNYRNLGSGVYCVAGGMYFNYA